VVTRDRERQWGEENTKKEIRSTKTQQERRNLGLVFYNAIE
jgi:hypothetical protein